MTIESNVGWMKDRTGSLSWRAQVVLLLFMFVCGLIAIMLRTPVAASPIAPDDPEIISSAADMDSDGVDDTAESRPTEGPGEVRISFTTLNQGEDVTVTLRGRDSGDRFGEDVAILLDVNGNGALDLIVGAPSAGPNDQGEAYVFFGPFQPPPPEPEGEDDLVVTADDADLTLKSFFPSDFDFGLRVGPLYDVTGDGHPELRVQSRLINEDDEEFVFTYVYHGGPTPGYPDGGELLFIAINLLGVVDFWAALPGDALGAPGRPGGGAERRLSCAGESGPYGRGDSAFRRRVEPGRRRGRR